MIYSTLFFLICCLPYMNQNLSNIQSRIATGNESTLAELYQLFYKRLYRFARVITRSDQIAEEVVDDVFVQLWTRRNKIAEIDNLTVYLYVAVKNRSLNELSRKAQELASTPFDYLDIELEESANNPH